MKKGLKNILDKYGYMIDTWSDETGDTDGQYWFNLKEGYINPELETNLITETSLASCSKQFRTIEKNLKK